LIGRQKEAAGQINRIAVGNLQRKKLNGHRRIILGCLISIGDVADKEKCHFPAIMAVWDCSSGSARSCTSVPARPRAEDTGLAEELSHRERPRPGRRRKREPHHFRFGVLSLAILLLSLLCGHAAAATPGDRRRSALARLAIQEELLVDRSEPPTPHMHLVRRQTSSGSRSSTSSVALSTILAPSGTSTAASTPSATSISVETSVASSSPLPQPFDTNLGNNFTNPNCPTFFSRFLADDTFQKCLPFSLLLQVRLGRKTCIK